MLLLARPSTPTGVRPHQRQCVPSESPQRHWDVEAQCGPPTLYLRASSGTRVHYCFLLSPSWSRRGACCEMTDSALPHALPSACLRSASLRSSTSAFKALWCRASGRRVTAPRGHSAQVVFASRTSERVAPSVVPKMSGRARRLFLRHRLHALVLSDQSAQLRLVTDLERGLASLARPAAS